MRRVLAAAAALMFGAGLAGAQTQPTTPAKGGCDAAPVATPTTPASQNSAGGTAPGNTGINGFTGAGLAGAYTGTSQNGPVPASPSVQPATAKGLDPIAAPPKASSTGNC